jgi:hypothetical protein
MGVIPLVNCLDSQSQRLRDPSNSAGQRRRHDARGVFHGLQTKERFVTGNPLGLNLGIGLR